MMNLVVRLETSRIAKPLPAPRCPSLDWAALVALQQVGPAARALSCLGIKHSIKTRAGAGSAGHTTEISTGSSTAWVDILLREGRLAACASKISEAGPAQAMLEPWEAKP